MQNIKDKTKVYQDLDGVSMNKLNIGLWYVEKRLVLIKMLKYFLILTSVICWSYFFYGFGYYIFFGMKEDDKLLTELVKNNLVGHDIIALKGAKELIINNPMVIRQNGRNDIISIIQNPNEKFFVKFDFVFRVGEKEIKRGSSFILPSDQNFLFALGQEVNTSEDPQIFIENIKWKRINPHTIPDWPSYRFSHLNFEITERGIIKADDFNKPENKSVNFAEVRFFVKNNTPFNYLDPEFIIILRNGYGISGINKYVINRFNSGEKREAMINWADAPSDAVNIEIIPNINIIDGDVYFKFDSENINTDNRDDIE